MIKSAQLSLRAQNNLIEQNLSMATMFMILLLTTLLISTLAEGIRTLVDQQYQETFTSPNYDRNYPKGCVHE